MALSDLDGIAQNFRARVDEAAAYGRKEQLNAMVRWLQRDGVIESTELWQASGVASLHAYAGVGSSLTRNMKGAGGTRNWYSGKRHPSKPGEWFYCIAPELIEPLKRAFLG